MDDYQRCALACLLHLDRGAARIDKRAALRGAFGGDREITLETRANHWRVDENDRRHDGENGEHNSMLHVGGAIRLPAMNRRIHDPARSAAGMHSSTSAAATTNATSGAKAESILALKPMTSKATTIAMAISSSTTDHGPCYAACAHDPRGQRHQPEQSECGGSVERQVGLAQAWPLRRGLTTQQVHDAKRQPTRHGIHVVKVQLAVGVDQQHHPGLERRKSALVPVRICRGSERSDQPAFAVTELEVCRPGA